MPVTRFAVLKGFNGVIMGRDLAGIFKNGHVYDVQEICGVFIINDLGEHALVQPDGAHISQIALSGNHCYSKEEHEKIEKKI